MSRSPSLKVSTLLASLGLAACSSPASPEVDPNLSLYALVQTLDGVSFLPPLGPPAGAPTGAFDATLAARLSVVLEASDAAGATRTLATFPGGLSLLADHELYWMNVPAPAYITDPALSYRFRVLLDGAELGFSDLSSHVFTVMRYVPNLPIGVKLRVETRAAPVITALSPSAAITGASSFALTVSGSAFAHDSIVRFAGHDLATTWVSAHSLTAIVPATLVASVGTYTVSVFTPAPGGGTSSASFTVTHGVPTLSALTPSSALAGSAALVVTLDGADFVAGATVNASGVSLPTTLIAPSRLTTSLPASLLASARPLSLFVNNPAPTNGPSSALVFTVNNPLPTLASVSPASATVLGSALTITLTGSGFNASSVVDLGALALSTTFVSATQLTAVVPSSALAATGSSAITVVNAAPGGGTSGAVLFSVVNPTPSITSLSPGSVVPGSTAFTLTITGSGFVPGAAATFQSTAVATTFVSSTRLTAAIPASLVASAGNWAVVVTNPAPGGGPSGVASFSVVAPTGATATLDPSHRGTGTVLSNGNLTVANSGYEQGIFATIGKSTGRWYWEVRIDGGLAPSGGPIIGIANGQQTVATYPTGSYGVGLYAQAGTACTWTGCGFSYGPGETVGDIIGVAMDVDANTVSWYKNGTLLGTRTGITFAKPWYPVVFNPSSSSTNTTTFNFGATPMVYSVSGYRPGVWIIDPVVTSMSPTSTPVGTGVTLTISGNTFFGGATVTFGGTPLNTTYVSSTQLLCDLPASMVSTMGTYAVTVSNPVANSAISTQYFGVLTSNPTATLDPGRAGPNIVLSNSNLSLTNTGYQAGIFATIGKSTGRWSWEVRLDNASPMMIGIANTSLGLTSYPAGTNGVSYYTAAGAACTWTGCGFSYSPGATTGDVIGVALDVDANTISWYKNGVLIGTKTNNTFAKPWYPVVYNPSSSSATMATFDFGASTFAFPIPGYNLGLWQ